ncbi:MAG: hypothetical protein M3Y38_04375, partial [Actinomycetota bacterium]|nr:hypothetical protein [Actinomycetota bacterium]
MPAHYEIINSYTRRARILPEVLSLAADEQGTLGVMTLVKICGITNAGDARTAADAGADAVGLVFADSPRRVDFEEARRISLALPEKILRVGVFVDEEPAEILRISRETGLDLAQLHGDETP